MLDRLASLATPLTLVVFAVAIGLLEFVVRPRVGAELVVNAVGFVLAFGLLAIGLAPLIRDWRGDGSQ